MIFFFIERKTSPYLQLKLIGANRSSNQNMRTLSTANASIYNMVSIISQSKLPDLNNEN